MGKFSRSVFINCPFDDEYKRILHPVLFTIIELGLMPRIASESFDSGLARLDKITDLMTQCQYSIHDLRRVPQMLNAMHLWLEAGRPNSYD